MSELLTQDNSNRFVIFPIQYQNLWDAYKNAQTPFGHLRKLI